MWLRGSMFSFNGGLWWLVTTVLTAEPCDTLLVPVSFNPRVALVTYAFTLRLHAFKHCIQLI